MIASKDGCVVLPQMYRKMVHTSIAHTLAQNIQLIILQGNAQWLHNWYDIYLK